MVRCFLLCSFVCGATAVPRSLGPRHSRDPFVASFRRAKGSRFLMVRRHLAPTYEEDDTIMPYTMPHHAPRKPHASRVVLIGLLMASLVGVIASASAAPIVSVTRHKDLGFRINTTFPPQHKGD